VELLSRILVFAGIRLGPGTSSSRLRATSTCSRSCRHRWIEVLMFHAKDDPNVPSERSKEFAEITAQN